MGRRPVVRVVAPALLVSALLAAPALAEEKKGTWETGFLLGSALYSKELGIDNVNEYGLRFGWYWKPAYELELQYRTAANSHLKDENSTLLNDASFAVPETVMFRPFT